jgi:hypothetical protein
MVVAASLILSAGLSQAQNQQQTDQQNQQQNQPQNQQPNQVPSSAQSQQPQSYTAPSSSQNSAGTSGGNSAQGTAQSGSQENNSSQSQSTAQSTSPSQSQNIDTVQTRLQPQTENGITYLCGGVGEEQASFMKQSKGDYDLMLTFATRTGEYLADVDVAIKDAKGKSVLNTTCGGPMLLVNLPKSGVYRVQAQAEDYSLRKTVKVKAKGTTNSVVMHWPRENETNQGVASTGSRQDAGSSGSSGGNASSGSNSSGNDSTKNRDNVTQPRQ